ETVADFKVAMAGSQLVFTVLPTTTAAGAAITPAVQVTVQDGLGNTVTSFSGTVTVTLGANPGPGTLAGHTTVAAVNGVATYANLTIDKAGVGYTLKATAPPLPAAPSVAFDIRAGAPAKLAIVTQPPASARSGEVFAQQPVIQLQDANGNPVSQAGVVVTASVASGSPTATLVGSSATTNAAGRATFLGLAITGPAGNYTLGFSAPTLPSLPSATSGPIALAAGAPSQLVIVTQPSSTGQSGVPLAPQPAIQIQDASGNPVSQPSVVVQASVAPAGATLSGGSATTTTTGRATFSGLAITGPSGSYTLSFSAPNLAAVTSTPVALGAGTAATIARNAGGSAAQVGTAVQPPPSVI